MKVAEALLFSALAVGLTGLMRIVHELGYLVAARILRLRIQKTRWLTLVSVDPSSGTRQRQSLAGLGGAPMMYLGLVAMAFVAVAVSPPTFVPPGPVVVGAVAPRAPAGVAGLRPGDAIVEVDGVAVDGLDSLIELTEAHEGEPTRYTIRRDGRRIEMEITPGQNPRGETRIGARPRRIPIGTGAMVVLAFGLPFRATVAQLAGVVQLASGEEAHFGARSMAYMIGEALPPTRVFLMGPLFWGTILLFLHLLPIPGTTGGRVLLPWLRSKRRARPESPSSDTAG